MWLMTSGYVTQTASVPENQSLCVNQGDKLLSFIRTGAWLMGNHFVKITDTKSFEELTDRSQERPIVIFKHSLTCPISSAAYAQMEKFQGEVALVEVQLARALSREIENRLGVPHESPQVIVLSKGQVTWNASHFKITSEAVAAAVHDAAENSREAVGGSRKQE
jgi:bacillithiol system protein YtxJ